MEKRCGHPNILWIMADQFKYTALDCMWNSLEDAPYEAKERNLTPNLDSLAEDGILFTNAYCPSPVCGPARASMKTGKYPPATGMVQNLTPLKEKNQYLPQILRDSGYETGMSGKLHLFPPDRDYGFEDRHLADSPYDVYWDEPRHSEYIKWLREEYYNARGVDPVELFNADESSYETDLKRFILGSKFRENQEHETGWTTDCTLEFLKKWDGKKPFFYYTSYFGPHQPYGVRSPYSEFIKPEEVRLPESYYHDFKKNAPVFQHRNLGTWNHIHNSLNEQDCRELIANYLGQVHMIDESIGKLIQELKDRNLYDDMVIIFSADHGDHLAEHGLFFKGEMYDSCAKVPLIIKPAKKTAGTVRNEIVNTIDLFQTILDLAECSWKPAPEEVKDYQTRSLVPLFEENAEWENITYSVFDPCKDHMLCMLRMGEWKLIRAAIGREQAVYELYHMTEDPLEHFNRYEDPVCRKIADRMQNMLDAWFRKEYMDYVAAGK